jgi:rod shape-determining protein MreC
VRLAADYERLEFLRVLRSHETERISEPGALIVPPMARDGLIGPLPAATPPEAADG